MASYFWGTFKGAIFDEMRLRSRLVARFGFLNDWGNTSRGFRGRWGCGLPGVDVKRARLAKLSMAVLMCCYLACGCQGISLYFGFAFDIFIDKSRVAQFGYQVDFEAALILRYELMNSSRLPLSTLSTLVVSHLVRTSFTMRSSRTYDLIAFPNVA